MISQLPILLTLQGLAGIISLTGTLIVFGVVIFLMVTSDKSKETGSLKNKVFKMRGRYLWGLSILIIIILFVFQRLLPYPLFQGDADEVVTVVGIQWDWEMAPGITNKKPDEFLGKNEISLPVNKRIKFIVTSGDVNHDFGIYNNKGVLLTQIQAMPKYKNELQYVFTKKGNYTILCLEYCGLAHPFMAATIHVY